MTGNSTVKKWWLQMNKGGMMKIIYLCLLVLVLAGCGQSSNPDNKPAPSEVELKASTFAGTSKYKVSGKVSLIQVAQDKFVKLGSDFKTDAGPDLHIWLVNDDANPATNHLDLGKLTTNQGTQRFAIPANTALANYSHIYIWCESVSELFGKANLTPTPDPDPDPDPKPVTIAEGSFSGDSVGDLEIVQTGPKRVINLASNFMANGTDDVSLYLAKDAAGADFVDLGKLAKTGAQSFAIPDSLDLEVFTYVIVWCNTISEVIGTANLSSSPDPDPDPDPEPTVILQGSFNGDSIGSVEVVQTGSSRVLKLASNFRANGTQQINIWLATNASGAGFIDLGDLNPTGAQSFAIPDSLNLSTYTYVIIWCADFNIVIGQAELN